MTTITWLIERLDCVPQSAEGADYVVTAYWRCNGVDGDHSGTAYGTCSFSVEAKQDYVPYADLTQDMVLGWVWANGVDKDSAEAAIEQQIQNQINPPIVSPPLPWS